MPTLPGPLSTISEPKIRQTSRQQQQSKKTPSRSIINLGRQTPEIPPATHHGRRRLQYNNSQVPVRSASKQPKDQKSPENLAGSLKKKSTPGKSVSTGDVPEKKINSARKSLSLIDLSPATKVNFGFDLR